MRTQDAEGAAFAPMVVILGPTASGKTALAVELARRLDGEVLSADSRQVYRGMDLGTGKDLSEYSGTDARTGEAFSVSYHLMDVADAGEEYNIFRYQQAFDEAYAGIRSRGRVPVLCGGSGLYLMAALGGKRFREVPRNEGLRRSLEGKSDAGLAELLASYGPLHNHTDTETRERCLRALEIAEFERRCPDAGRVPPSSLLFGIAFEPEVLRQRIGQRLDARLQAGMVDEVRALLSSGLKPEQLIYYGLEYKFITQYLRGDFSYEEMREKLYFAICQFAKRQRTWFRKMEREGYRIEWIDGNLPVERKADLVLETVQSWDG